MIASLLAQGSDWIRPDVDWHALAPELVLIIGINVVLAVDLWIDESKKWIMASLAGFIMLGAFIPVVTLAVVSLRNRKTLETSEVILLVFLAAYWLVPLIAGRAALHRAESTLLLTVLLGRRLPVGALLAFAAAFERGRGVPRDPVRALAWYRLAAESGDDKARQMRIARSSGK